MINKKNYFSLFVISLIIGGLIVLLSMVGGNSNKNNSPPTYNPTKSDLLDIGEKHYNASCSGCHKRNGLGNLPRIPAIKGSTIANNDKQIHISIVLNGLHGMPSFRYINDTNLASIISYQRLSFGNSGDLVSPIEVYNFRNRK
jgi:mono/diheme cytochrome c family protein